GLTKLLADNAPKAMKEQKFESYFGRKIAIDASMSIYQFLVRSPSLGPIPSIAPEIFNSLSFPLFLRDFIWFTVILFLIDCRGKNWYGDPHQRGWRSHKVTRQHNEDCKRLLRLMGVPIIENAKLSLFISKAPCEAEAQCATLCKSDKATDVLP
ncbi:hypothetical protein GW17_00005248, partial [Ensete ventricosum]